VDNFPQNHCSGCRDGTHGAQPVANVKRQHWLKRKLYILEDVSAEVCKECEERYFHAKTLDAIDRYLLKEHTVKANLNVEVVSVSQAMA
jgi:YgiT-type zinc finger domain-containing protein